jgi:hypothetical protein
VRLKRPLLYKGLQTLTILQSEASVHIYPCGVRCGAALCSRRVSRALPTARHVRTGLGELGIDQYLSGNKDEHLELLRDGAQADERDALMCRILYKQR